MSWTNSVLQSDERKHRHSTWKMIQITSVAKRKNAINTKMGIALPQLAVVHYSFMLSTLEATLSSCSSLVDSWIPALWEGPCLWVLLILRDLSMDISQALIQLQHQYVANYFFCFKSSLFIYSKMWVGAIDEIDMG